MLSHDTRHLPAGLWGGVDSHEGRIRTMRFALLSRLALVLTCGALLLSLAAPALAADIQQGDSVVIGPDQVVNDDVYAFGSNVQVLGTINGDLFAAGNTVTIGGRVNGSVFAGVTRFPS